MTDDYALSCCKDSTPKCVDTCAIDGIDDTARCHGLTSDTMLPTVSPVTFSISLQT